jgi:hypothetical protein
MESMVTILTSASFSSRSAQIAFSSGALALPQSKLAAEAGAASAHRTEAVRQARFMFLSGFACPRSARSSSYQPSP